MTFECALNKIKTKFENVDATKLADMAVQVTLTDEDCGGTLYFKSADNHVDVEGYDYRDNDAAIEIERKSLMDILAGKSDLDKAIEKGKATARGNFEKLDTLKAAIPAYVVAAKSTATAEKKPAAKKAPVKKTTAAKTTAKKTTARKTTAKNKTVK